MFNIKINKITIVAGALALMSVATAFAQDTSGDPYKEADKGGVARQDPYRQMMRGFAEERRNAKTQEERDAVQAKIKSARAQYRPARPVKGVIPAGKKEQRRNMEGRLKKNPFRLEISQLEQSMAEAKTDEEREIFRAKIQDLQVKYAAEEEAKLTPEQKVARAERAAKNSKMREELAPLMENMRSAKTEEDRNTIRSQMREIRKKYR
ncbi:MAG: hypothetical protein A2234_05960 [Elusimicrobia bacterium RIFOXYA2_FULL_58_8]|nr:MAG: hypothetical protein A2285_06595 [Elusimicrobia bacterium RIFOXYA12_FULL_57_11]OGS12821.1 MAG: hypothetical protein A2234_05960 [Elusimicrobia bacterium RIFOXYA2_FULL_58_8]